MTQGVRSFKNAERHDTYAYSIETCGDALSISVLGLTIVDASLYDGQGLGNDK